MPSFSSDFPWNSGLEPILAEWLPSRRWFRAKTKRLTQVAIEAEAPLPQEAAQETPHFCVVKAEFEDSTFERYALPLILPARNVWENYPEKARVGWIEISGADGVQEKSLICDASWDPGFRNALRELLEGKREALLGEGILTGSSSVRRALPASSASNVLGAEQSNTAFSFLPAGPFVKLYRRIEEAVNPEPEVLRFLRERTSYRHVPRFEASLIWKRPGSTPVTLALMQELVAGEGDAWEYVLRALHASLTPTPGLLAWLRLLGRRVAGLHAALASRPDDPVFAPEPLTSADLDHARQGTAAMLRNAFEAMTTLETRGDEGLDALVRTALSNRARLEARLQKLTRSDALAGAVKIRSHGDLHLGQILVGATPPGANDGALPEAWILDFEGEPGRPMAEGRRKQSPLRDVAGMLRSFHYAAHTAARRLGHAPGSLAGALCEAFLQGYQSGGDPNGRFAAPPAGHEFPADPGENPSSLLEFFVLEKVVYEIHYELNNRPDWLEIPLRGLLEMIRENGDF